MSDWRSRAKPVSPAEPVKPAASDWRARAKVVQVKTDEPSTMEVAKDIGTKALVGAGRVMDYLGGAARTSLAAAADPFVEGDLVRADEVTDSLMMKRQFPESDEYMERAGIPAGASLSDVVPGAFNESGRGIKLQKGGPLDFTARGTGGTAVDIFLDPSTYATFGLAPAAKLLLAPGRIASEKVGKKIFKSGLKNVDAAGHKVGKQDVSDLLWERDIYGSNAKIANQMADQMQKLDAQREALFDAAEKAGAVGDPMDAAARLFELADEAAKVPALRAEGVHEKIRNRGFEYLLEAPQTPRVLSQWKTAARESLPKGAWDAGTRSNAEVAAIKSEAQALQEAAEKATRGAGFGDELADINSEWGTYLSTIKQVGKEALKGKNKNYITSVDPIVFGIGRSADRSNVDGGWLLALKKAADIAKTTNARTTVGHGLKALGRSAVAYPLVKRGYIELSETEADQPKRSPWSLMGR